MNNVAPGTRDLDARATRPTPADLAAIKAGTDPLLTTYFLNRGTFAAEEMPYYPYDLRRTYVAELGTDEDEPWIVSDEVRFFAADDESAGAWLRANYTPDAIASLVEIRSSVRSVAYDAHPERGPWR